MPRPPRRRPGIAGPTGAFKSVSAYDTTPQISSVTPNSSRVQGGATITIIGNNFRALGDGTLPIVLFNSTPATNVVVVDARTLTATIPAVTDTGSYNISVTVGSQTGTAIGVFTYYAGLITNVTPAYCPLAGGVTVLISGVNFVTGCTITFGGVSATNVTFVDDQNYSVTAPAHAVGFVDIEMDEPSGSIVLGRHAFQYTFLTRGQDIRRNPGTTIRDVLNSQPNTCTFDVDGASNIPVAGEEIRIVDEFDADRLLFAGNVLTIEQGYNENTKAVVWSVDCVDFTWALTSKKRPYGVYINVSVSDIVKDLVSKYAPGFTTNHVQSNLARITIVLDGSDDFGTVLSNMASNIGGGHWYVDYTRDVHFFHVQPDIFNDIPQSIVRSGPGTALTAAQGSGIPSTFRFPPAFYLFQTTNVYDNGTESAMSPSSIPVPFTGESQVVLSNIPIGAAAGTHSVVKRRIYYTYAGPIGGTHNFRSRKYYCEINDNTTTGFTSWFGEVGANSSAISGPPSGKPRNIAVVPPNYSPASAVAPAAVQNLLGSFLPQTEIAYPRPLPFPFTAANYAFKVSNIYQDLTESLPGPATAVITLDGLHGVTMTDIPIGDTINGVPVIARRIYGSQSGNFDPTNTVSWWLIPNNTATVAFINPATATYIGTYFAHFLLAETLPPDRPIGVPTSSDTPVWPNPDGPSLELDSPPDDIDDDNPDLLRDQPFKSTTDMSQVRNRVMIRGSGTTLIFGANIADTSLTVAECAFFSPTGGQIYINGYILNYVGLSELSGGGDIFLTQALSTTFDVGSVVVFYLQVDDTDSQEALAKVELDVNGNPTDGIHETVIVDNSLTTPFQLYQRAYAELELFAKPIKSANYSTTDPKTRSGAIVHINLTDPPCTGDFLIQDVTIDRVRDEGDDQKPRYTVSASSVKFELTDLLSKIISGGGAPSASAAGLVAAATSQSGFDPTTKRVGWAFHLSDTIANPVFHNVGISAAGASGTSPVYDSSDIAPIGDPAVITDLRWLTCATSAVLNNTSGVKGSDGFYPEQNFDWTFIVKTGINIANLIYWVGLTNSPTVPTSKAGINIALCTFRYSPLDGDSGWVAVLQPTGVGHAQTVTGSIAAVAPSTYYKMRIKSVGGPSSTSTAISFSINDGPFLTVAYADSTNPGATPPNNMPIRGSGGSMMSPLVGVANMTAAVKKISWQSWCVVLDN